MSGKIRIAEGPFLPTWDSLRQYGCPEWFRDAKFGIWAHWGPQCVPMCGDWYARGIYQEGSHQYLHHWRNYGHPSMTGYKDIIPLWKAEKFDPESLMDEYSAAGAKYFVAQAVHHDNFDNWDSAHNPWNSVRMGPMRDIVGDWKRAAERRGLPFGLSEHLGASFSWSTPNKGADKTGPYAGIPYDGRDPAYESLYHPNQEDPGIEGKWYTENPWWAEKWFDRIKDLVDKYQPDLLYSDGGIPFGEYGLGIIAHLYNTSAKANGGANRAVYNQKDTDPMVFNVGVLDIERGGMDKAAEYVWQTDTCVGGWYYDLRAKYKTPRQVITTLVDIVSKNGNLLLNLTQRPDGSLDDECHYILRCLKDWFAANAEGIYGTRPWKVAGEGPTVPKGGAFNEAELPYGPEDFRFTSKDGSVYAFQMGGVEGGKAVIPSLAEGNAPRVKAVYLLTPDGLRDVTFHQRVEGLELEYSVAQGAAAFPICFKVDFDI